LKNVKELIYKKGRGFFDKEPFPLTSNDLIEKVCFGSICHRCKQVIMYCQPPVSEDFCFENHVA
jgi:hypothetical protein